MIRLELSPPERVPWIASKTMRTLTVGRTETTVMRCVDAASLDDTEVSRRCHVDASLDDTKMPRRCHVDALPDDTKNVAICSLSATPKASKRT
jgi:hypothetical protein